MFEKPAKLDEEYLYKLYYKHYEETIYVDPGDCGMLHGSGPKRSNS